MPARESQAESALASALMVVLVSELALNCGGSSSQSSQSFMNTSGTAPRNRNGHFGKAAPATNISPQSQMVPSTSPSSIMSTPICCSLVTVTPEINGRFWSHLGPEFESTRGPFWLCSAFCSGRNWILRHERVELNAGRAFELVSVWTTWPIRTVSARAGTAVKNKTHTATMNSERVAGRCAGSF